ncbi:hypothetical protein CIB87_28055 [Priestia megaterium]|uniref:Uncharacterized protein n=1 Tax=Priestia megaterium TaxID=1404 RepID=A0AA86I666_PRIMG|nr:hypothetical protein [Priestia megaterium]AXI32645.1 hypothetical protein CIB87_28055 [Priestia megaterium]
MTIGLTEQTIISMLDDTELKPETIKVIAQVIVANNKMVEKKITDVVMSEISKKMNLRGF